MWINDFLSKALGFSPKKIYQDNRTNVWSICLYQDDCEKIFKFMYYKDRLPYLERKYKVFESWFSDIRNEAKWRWGDKEKKQKRAISSVG